MNSISESYLFCLGSRTLIPISSCFKKNVVREIPPMVLRLMLPGYHSRKTLGKARIVLIFYFVSIWSAFMSEKAWTTQVKSASMAITVVRRFAKSF